MQDIKSHKLGLINGTISANKSMRLKELLLGKTKLSQMRMLSEEWKNLILTLSKQEHMLSTIDTITLQPHTIC